MKVYFEHCFNRLCFPSFTRQLQIQQPQQQQNFKHKNIPITKHTTLSATTIVITKHTTSTTIINIIINNNKKPYQQKEVHQQYLQ
jgi:hypothetical protein